MRKLNFPCDSTHAYLTATIDQWHPSAPRLASTTTQGDILIWHCPSPERWGAFAGGFEEADENVWYEEGESEFDLVSRVTGTVKLNQLKRPYRKMRPS